MQVDNGRQNLQPLTANRFLNKLQSKNNIELERIAENSKDYVLEARHAAAQLLKQRHSDSKAINTVRQEVKSQQKGSLLSKAQI